MNLTCGTLFFLLVCSTHPTHNPPSYLVLYAIESLLKPLSPHSVGTSFRSVDVGFAVRWPLKTTIIIDDLGGYFDSIEEQEWGYYRPIPRDFDRWDFSEA